MKTVDPECRKEGPTKCCNCFFEEDVKHWVQVYRDEYKRYTEAVALAIKNQTKMPSPIPAFPEIDLENLDIFQGDQAKAETPMRYGQQVYSFRCWLNLGDEHWLALLSPTYWRDRSKVRTLSRLSKQFTVVCAIFEGLWSYSEVSERKWDDSEVDGSPSKILSGAKCHPVTIEQWASYQLEYLAQRSPDKSAAPLWVNRHPGQAYVPLDESQKPGPGRPRKRKQSSIIVQHNSKTRCVEFPRLGVVEANTEAAAVGSISTEPSDTADSAIIPANTANDEAARTVLQLLTYATPAANTDSSLSTGHWPWTSTTAEPIDSLPSFDSASSSYGLDDLFLPLAQHLQVTANHPFTHETHVLSTSAPGPMQDLWIPDDAWFTEMTLPIGTLPEKHFNDLHVQSCVTSAQEDLPLKLYAELLEILGPDDAV